MSNEKKARFKGKVVLVTGGTRGIGRAIAEAFFNEGASVAIYGRTEGSVNSTIREFPNFTPAVGDVGKVSGCKDAVTSVLKKFGKLDVLINNAGIFEKHSIEQTTEEIWDSVMNANVRSVQFCIKYAVEALRESKGSIVNIASESGLNGYPFTSA